MAISQWYQLVAILAMGPESWDFGTLRTLKKFLREIKFGKLAQKKN